MHLILNTTVLNFETRMPTKIPQTFGKFFLSDLAVVVISNTRRQPPKRTWC